MIIAIVCVSSTVLLYVCVSQGGVYALSLYGMYMYVIVLCILLTL